MRSGVRAITTENGGRSWLRSWTGIGALFLMFAAATLLASCGEDQSQQGGGEETAPSGEEAESAGQAQAVSLADITDNPSEFYGKQVTISGLVTDELGPDSFAIGGDESSSAGIRCRYWAPSSSIR